MTPDEKVKPPLFQYIEAPKGYHYAGFYSEGYVGIRVRWEASE